MNKINMRDVLRSVTPNAKVKVTFAGNDACESLSVSSVRVGKGRAGTYIASCRRNDGSEVVLSTKDNELVSAIELDLDL